MQNNLKKLAAEKAVEYVKSGMSVGLGTGSTAYWAIQKLGERVKEGLKIKAIATSVQSADLAKQLKIPVLELSKLKEIDITIDGADEVDKHRNLTKGGGGALLREKIIAFHTKTYLVVVDETKLVSHLGKFPLPLEIIPFGLELTMEKLKSYTTRVHLRRNEGKPFITDNGNYIADAQFDSIDHPEQLNRALHDIPGVVETGLFSHKLVTKVIIGKKDGSTQIL